MRHALPLDPDPARPCWRHARPAVNRLQSTDGIWLGVITPYRIDIMQGNVVTQEQAALVKPGMSREQVRDLLGSPLLTSAFHAERWDYVFTLRRQGVEPQRIAAWWRLQGRTSSTSSKRPSCRARTSSSSFGAFKPERKRRPSASRMLALTDEQKKALPPPVRTETPASAAPDAARAPCGASYPPLEPRHDAYAHRRGGRRPHPVRMGRMLIEAVEAARRLHRRWPARSTSAATSPPAWPTPRC